MGELQREREELRGQIEKVKGEKELWQKRVRQLALQLSPSTGLLLQCINLESAKDVGGERAFVRNRSHSASVLRESVTGVQEQGIQRPPAVGFLGLQASRLMQEMKQLEQHLAQLSQKVSVDRETDI